MNCLNLGKKVLVCWFRIVHHLLVMRKERILCATCSKGLKSHSGRVSIQVHAHIHVQFRTWIPSLPGVSSSAQTLCMQQGQAQAVLPFQVTWKAQGQDPKTSRHCLSMHLEPIVLLCSKRHEKLEHAMRGTLLCVAHLPRFNRHKVSPLD